MVPAKLVHTAVTMLTDALPQLPDLVDQLLPCHLIEVFVHNVPPLVSMCS
jgi:hypothetical protein